MKEEFDEYEAISTHKQNGQFSIVKGTKRPQWPKSAHYDKSNGISRPRTPLNGVELVRKWLDDDTGFTLSQYREWLQEADRFLEGVTYSKTEHIDLLVRAFELYVTKHT